MEMTSYEVSVGTNIHPFAADRAEEWSAGEPVFFLPWLQNHCPGGPFIAILDFLCLLLPALSLSPSFLKHSKLSFTCKFCYVFYHSVWQCFHTREQLTLPCHFSETCQVSSLTFIPSCFLPSLSDSRLFFHLEKKSQTLCETQSLGCLWLDCHAF